MTLNNSINRCVLLTAVMLLVYGCASRPFADCSDPVVAERFTQECAGHVAEETIVPLPQNVSRPIPSVTASVSPYELGVVSYRPEYLIATDLIKALTQITPYSSRGTLIKIPAAESTFLNALESVLRERGQVVERSRQKTGAGVLMASVFSSSERRAVHTFIVAIDRVALKREYRIGPDRVVAPVSSLYVRGAPAHTIALDDQMFLE